MRKINDIDPALLAKIKAIKEASDAAYAAKKADEAARLQPEALQELSKKTLGRYVVKAAHKMAIAHADRAVAQATSDEVDRMTNRNGMKDKYKVQDDIKKSLGADNATQMKHLYTTAKRAQGIAGATDRLVKGGYTKEEAEQVQEDCPDKKGYGGNTYTVKRTDTGATFHITKYARSAASKARQVESRGIKTQIYVNGEPCKDIKAHFEEYDPQIASVVAQIASDVKEGVAFKKFPTKPAPDAAKNRKEKADAAAKDAAERADIAKASDEMGRGRDKKGNIVREEDEHFAALDEACKDHELHVAPSKTKKGHYEVKAVGKNFADGIKVGEHLSDTHLDDATEMGAKIKMVKEGFSKDEGVESKEELAWRQKMDAVKKREKAKEKDSAAELSDLENYSPPKKKTVKEGAITKSEKSQFGDSYDDYKKNIKPHTYMGKLASKLKRQDAKKKTVKEEAAIERVLRVLNKEEYVFDEDFLDFDLFVVEEMALVEVLEEGKNSVTPTTSYKYAGRTYTNKDELAHTMASHWLNRHIYGTTRPGMQHYGSAERKTGKIAKAYDKANTLRRRGKDTNKADQAAEKSTEDYHKKAHRRIMKVLNKEQLDYDTEFEGLEEFVEARAYGKGRAGPIFAGNFAQKSDAAEDMAREWTRNRKKTPTSSSAFQAKAQRRIMKVLTKEGVEAEMTEQEVDLLFAEGLDTSDVKVFENDVELNWLDEMAKRGRPRKNPLPAGAEEAGPEADQHIIMQLRKAENMDDKGGKKEVEFKDGSKHVVASHVAKSILAFHEKLKPESKEHLQNMIHKSHKHLMDVHAALTAQNKK